MVTGDWVTRWVWGQCPVPPYTPVEVRLRNQNSAKDRAGTFSWYHCNWLERLFFYKNAAEYDIVAYRIIDEADLKKLIPQSQRGLIFNILRS